MNPQIEIHLASSLSPQRRAELEDWFYREFGHVPYHWDSPKWYVVALLNSTLVGRLGLIERGVSVSEHTIPIGGVSGVITHREWRRHGIARALLGRTVEFITGQH